MNQTRNAVFLIIVTTILLFVFYGSVFATSKQIALFSFEINSEKNFSFLEKGIFEMLSTRFRAEKYNIVRGEKKDALTKDDIRRFAGEKNADYAVSGNIMVFGNSINISASLYNGRSGESILAFNKSDDSRESLFNHLNFFADKALLKMREQEDAVVVCLPSVKKEAVASSVLSTPLFKSRTMDGRVISLSTGDVNGDGKTDIVFIKDNDICIAGYQDEKFETETRIKSRHYLKHLFVDLVDTDKNGIAEIYVTSTHRTTKSLQSGVLAWNGKNYDYLAQKEKWFFAARALKRDGEKILMGQKQHFAEGSFSKTPYQLFPYTSEDKLKFKPFEKIELPEYTTIYDFACGDLIEKGVNNVITFTSGGYLAVYDANKSLVWKSSVRFGDTLKYIEPRKAETQKRFYLPPRIFAADIDKDSVTEIVTIMNHNASPRAFVNLKNFTNGFITCLSWKNLAFETRWNTQRVSGYIPDFAIDDIDNNGKNDLIYCVVIKTGKFFKKGQTYFVIQPLG